jgi:hypothetical protein
MWEIATEAGYDHAILTLRTAAEMPYFQQQSSGLLLAIKALEDARSATSWKGWIISDVAAQDEFLTAAVSLAS